MDLSTITQHTREYLISRIQDIMLNYTSILAEGIRPELSLPNLKEISLLTNDEHDIEDDVSKLCSPNKLTITTASRHIYVITILDFLLRHLQNPLNTVTMRDIYYQRKDIFDSQTKVDRAVLDVAAMLGVQRSDLGIVGAGRGLLYGPISLHFGNDGIPDDDIFQHKSEALSVTKKSDLNPDNVTSLYCGTHPVTIHQRLLENMKLVNHGAKHILVVEKEGVFLNLIQSNLQKIYPCIIISGNGFPPLAVRALVYSIQKQTQLPISGIFDCNPFGVAIYLQYAQGGSVLLGGSRFAIPQMRMCGLLPRHLQHLHKAGFLENVIGEPLTKRDQQLAEKLLNNNFILQNRDLHENVQDMLELGLKYELQVLFQHSFTYLSETYIPSLIQ